MWSSGKSVYREASWFLSMNKSILGRNEKYSIDNISKYKIKKLSHEQNILLRLEY